MNNTNNSKTNIKNGTNNLHSNFKNKNLVKNNIFKYYKRGYGLNYNNDLFKNLQNRYYTITNDNLDAGIYNEKESKRIYDMFEKLNRATDIRIYDYFYENKIYKKVLLISCHCNDYLCYMEINNYNITKLGEISNLTEEDLRDLIFDEGIFEVRLPNSFRIISDEDEAEDEAEDEEVKDLRRYNQYNDYKFEYNYFYIKASQKITTKDLIKEINKPERIQQRIEKFGFEYLDTLE